MKSTNASVDSRENSATSSSGILMRRPKKSLSNCRSYTSKCSKLLNQVCWLFKAVKDYQMEQAKLTEEEEVICIKFNKNGLKVALIKLNF